MAKAEPKLGRPRKPPGEKKSGRIEIRVTEAEHAAMEAAAARAELPLSEWLRDVALKAARRTS
ncbi:MAG TPA: toxin-antitoxin system HicB family antitoxin [Polyangiaceae bacterium]|jgi:predicted HicB family RNase H-like nuclease|nr:toxin-antitoxin system HicB family antitoxin [Polyangiaceae bacterium]